MSRYLLDRQRTERGLRRLLRLPPDGPDPSGHRLVPRDNGMYELLAVPEDEQQAAWAAWHAQPARARWAEATARRLYVAEYRLRASLEGLDREDFRRQPLTATLERLPGGPQLQRARAERRLRNARTLHLHSLYIHPDPCHHFEGHLDLGDGVSFRVEFGSRQLVAQQLHGRDATLRELDPTLTFPEVQFVDVDALTPQLLEQALGDWYQARYRYTPGHWTQPQGLRPRVVLHAAFEPQEQYYDAG